MLSLVAVQGGPEKLAWVMHHVNWWKMQHFHKSMTEMMQPGHPVILAGHHWMCQISC